MGRIKDEQLRRAFAVEQDRAHQSLARRASEANVQDFLSLMATAGASPEPVFARIPGAPGQEYFQVDEGWIVSWSASEAGSDVLNLPFFGLMLLPDGTFRDFEAGYADPLPYGASPSDFMATMGVGSFMLRMGGRAPAPDFSSGMPLKSLAACARRYLDLVP